MSDVDNKNARLGQQNIDSNVYNYYGEKKIKKYLGALPFFTETFLGRDNDLEAVHQKLFAGNNLLLLVNGEGGIGKTTLAAEYYLMYRDDYQHLAWVYVATSLADALLTLALPFGLSFPDAMTAIERIQLLLDELRNLNKPCLLVIDNANELKDLEENYLALRRCANFHLLLTTRITSFEQAATHRIQHLEKGAAIDLFKKYYSKHKPEENELLEKVLAAVGYNTLVIELLAKNLGHLNKLRQQYSLTQLHEDLKGKGLLGLQLATPVSTVYQATGNALRKESPEAIIGAMYELSELEKEETALLSVFSILPAESIGFEILEQLMPDNKNLEELLTSLAQKGWLDYNETDASFKISPVIQEITKKKNQQLLEDCSGVLEQLTEKLLYEAGTGHFTNVSYEQAALYARYAEAAINGFQQADDTIALLCERVGNYQKTTGNLLKALSFFEEYNRLGKELYEAYPQNVGFKNGLAISYSKLGETQAALGDLHKALQYYEERSRLGKELYEAYPQNVEFKNGLAISYSKLGETQAALGDLHKALQYYEDETTLFEELYEAYPQNVGFKNGLAISYSKLGQTQAALGDLNKALQYYEKDAQLSKELYEAYPQNVEFKNGLALSYQWLGWANEQKEEKEIAKEYYRLSEEHLSQLVTRFPAYAQFQKNLQWVQNRLAVMEGE